MSEARLTGGTADDHAAILRLHEDYIDVNARFDWQKLQPIFSPAPEAIFFNLNGHTYRGREHWTNLWKFYAQNVQSSYWTPYDIGGAVGDEVAVVWCHRKTKRQWTGTEPPPRDINYNSARSSRAPPWCSARRTGSGASFTRISPRPMTARGRAASDAAAATEHPPARRHDGAAMRGHGNACRRRGPRGHLVCGESVQPRHPAGRRRLRGRDAPAADRGRRVQSVQPSSDA